MNLKNLLQYIPSSIVQRIEQNKPWNLPETQPLECIIMLVHIKGLTEVKESYGRKKLNEFVFSVSRYMEVFISLLDQYGGELIKFLGDRMFIIWDGKKEELKVTMQRAIQCALKMKAEFAGRRIIKESSLLSIKISIGIDKLNILYLGGIQNHVEYLITGATLQKALNSIEGNDKVILSKECYELIQDYVKIIEGSNEVIGIKDDYKSMKVLPLNRTKLK